MRDREVRYRAVVHYLHFCRSLRKVAKIYGVSKSSLQRWVQARSPTQRVRTLRKKSSAQKLHAAIGAIFQQNPFTTMQALARRLQQEHGLQVSPSTAWRMTRDCGFTWKKAFKAVAVQHDEQAILSFCKRYLGEKSSDHPEAVLLDKKHPGPTNPPVQMCWTQRRDCCPG